jgi:hypothetical protein
VNPQMSNWTQEDVDRVNAQRGWKVGAVRRSDQPPTPKKSKYRNVKVVIDGQKFDSQREAAHWSELKLREQAGEIRNLRRQLNFQLWPPAIGQGAWVEVANYCADFVFDDHDGKPHVQDVKGGKETAMFALKRKWLFLQSGIEIEVIR